jgi:aspartyl/glutamyl-tRNA(Asn/Gln) amidotransferase C subunit
MKIHACFFNIEKLKPNKGLLVFKVIFNGFSVVWLPQFKYDLSMTNIDIDDICDLSALLLNQGQKNEFSKQIQTILNYMDVLNARPMPTQSQHESPLGGTHVQRDDQPQLFQHDLMVENAPDYSADGFVVPKIAS